MKKVSREVFGATRDRLRRKLWHPPIDMDCNPLAVALGTSRPVCVVVEFAVGSEVYVQVSGNFNWLDKFER